MSDDHAFPQQLVRGLGAAPLVRAPSPAPVAHVAPAVAGAPPLTITKASEIHFNPRGFWYAKGLRPHDVPGGDWKTALEHWIWYPDPGKVARVSGDGGKTGVWVSHSVQAPTASPDGSGKTVDGVVHPTTGAWQQLFRDYWAWQVWSV